MPSAALAEATVLWEPNSIPQWEFLSTEADIAIYGGAGGGGKTDALLAEALRHVGNPKFRAAILRRELTRIRQVGAMWDRATELYTPLGGKPRQSPDLEFSWPSGAVIRFGHCEHESTIQNWQGSQVALFEFDQLEEFTERMFWYISMARGRSASGVTPYVRASCNPVPADDPVGGWLNKLISWWIDPKSGYAIPERSGVILWLARLGNDIRWSGSKEEAIEVCRREGLKSPENELPIKSFTFISALATDNPDLDPSYHASLASLAYVDRERMKHGNWHVKPEAGKILNRAWFRVIPLDSLPPAEFSIRAWDTAATQDGGDWTAGIKMIYADRKYIITDVVRGQWSYGNRDVVRDSTAAIDGYETEIVFEQEPGGSGKQVAEAMIADMAGYIASAERATRDKVTRAKALSAYAEITGVYVINAEWTQGFLDRLHNFTGKDGGVDDEVDACSLAFNRLSRRVREGGFWVRSYDGVQSDEDGHDDR